jgi:hypothetical protein
VGAQAEWPMPLPGCDGARDRSLTGECGAVSWAQLVLLAGASLFLCAEHFCIREQSAGCCAACGAEGGGRGFTRASLLRACAVHLRLVSVQVGAEEHG